MCSYDLIQRFHNNVKVKTKVSMWYWATEENINTNWDNEVVTKLLFIGWATEILTL